jgi:maltose alpha-D-glucosyltransferase/alpha-amylase
MGGFPAEQQSLARHVLSSWPMLERRAGSLLALGKEGVVAIRIHGDYHLGQLLVSHGRGFQIIDFEGEPVRSLEERRARGTPLRDVAGMLRSLAYVARSARRARDPACVDAALEAWAEVWEGSAREAFLAGYLDTVRGEPFLPRDPGVVRSALVALEIEKALLEIRYELDHRPDWLAIPLEGLGRMLSA